MTPAEEMERLAARAREAARAMSRARAEIKTRALIGLADQLAAREEEILTANRKDLDAARAAGLDAPRLDRLTLTPATFLELYTVGALTHKSTQMEIGGARKEAVEAAESVEAVDALLVQWGL